MLKAEFGSYRISEVGKAVSGSDLENPPRWRRVSTDAVFVAMAGSPINSGHARLDVS